MTCCLKRGAQLADSAGFSRGRRLILGGMAALACPAVLPASQYKSIPSASQYIVVWRPAAVQYSRIRIVSVDAAGHLAIGATRPNHPPLDFIATDARRREWPSQTESGLGRWIAGALQGSEMIIVAASLGRAAATEDARLVAEIARQAGAWTVGIGLAHSQTGEVFRSTTLHELALLRGSTDAVVCLSCMDRREGRDDAALSDNQLPQLGEAFYSAAESLVASHAAPNDFHTGCIEICKEDLRYLLSGKGLAVAGWGYGIGPERALQAARQALSRLAACHLGAGYAKSIILSYHAEAAFSMKELKTALDETRKALANERTEMLFRAAESGGKAGSVRVGLLALMPS